VDLRAIRTPPTDDERACVDAALGTGWADPVGLRAARAERHRLLPCLHAVQQRFGYITPGALGYLSERLHVPPAEAYGVASFYALFALAPRAPTVAHVCDDVVCKAAGADALCDALGPAGAARDGVEWHRSPCLGLCEKAPAALVTVAGERPFERAFGHATADAVTDALHTRSVAPPPPTVLAQVGDSSLRVLARVGRVDPTSLDDYRAHGGYLALRRAVEMGAGWVIRELTDAGLSGRGGAAFPAGRKWDAVAKATGRLRHVVCNADESEPGTFKDRVLMEEDPFAVVEAMTLAGFAVGAERGWIYLRAEYPFAAERLQRAIDAARARGLLGDDVLGRGFRFDIEVRRGAGAYICGEETALLNSLEGYRGEPRSKPPFPVEVGLFGQPTLIHNVETLANVPWIVREGAAAFRSVGTKDSPGTRLFCLSGAVRAPGVYELPFGVTLGALIERAGGLREGRSLRAVLLGGAAGGFVDVSSLDLPLTLEDTRRAGATLGSGVVFVLDDSVAIGPVLQRIAAFFRDESCGQCVPCRVGTVRQEELVARLVAGRPHGGVEQELALLQELAQAMRDASICGLGQTATGAIESALVRLRVLQPHGESR
jgi:NADH-quinone oxidoreductase subunit F